MCARVRARVRASTHACKHARVDGWTVEWCVHAYKHKDTGPEVSWGLQQSVSMSRTCTSLYTSVMSPPAKHNSFGLQSSEYDSAGSSVMLCPARAAGRSLGSV